MIKDRRKKIHQAAREVELVNYSKKTGLQANVQGSDSVYSVNISPARKEKGNVLGQQINYKSYFVQCKNGKKCQGNNNAVCYHGLAVIEEALHLSGYTFYLSDEQVNILRTLNKKDTLLKVSSPIGTAWGKAQPRTTHCPFETLKQLITEERIAIKPNGQIPVGKGIMLVRRNDDRLVFRQGGRFSKPVARLGKQLSMIQSKNWESVWKMTDEAEKNWEKFNQ